MRLESLTFFRFIAAAIVVIYHHGAQLLGLNGFLAAGPQMVTFFFVLSGFVMGISYLENPPDKKSYWFARAARILPVYWLALALMIFIDLLIDRPVNCFSLLLNLALLQSWFPEHALTINSPGWSLSVEAFFYLAFPFIANLIKRYNTSWKPLLAIATLLWLITHGTSTYIFENGYYSIFPSISHSLIYYFPLVHICSFIFGIAGALYITSNNNYRIRLGLSFPALGIILLSIVFLINSQEVIAHNVGLNFAFASSFWAPLFLLFIIVLSKLSPLVSGIFEFKILKLLGESSFSLYILQEPVFRIFNFIGKKFGFQPITIFAAFSAGLIVIAIYCFKHFERPLNRKLKSLIIRYS